MYGISVRRNPPNSKSAATFGGLRRAQKTNNADSPCVCAANPPYIESALRPLRRERNRLEKADATDTPEPIRQSITESTDFLEQQLAKLQQTIDQHINRHPNLKQDRDLLISIPAVGPQVGNHMLSALHNHKFKSAEQLAPYLGLVPVERQSGSSVLGRSRLSKAGPTRIRAMLFMAAIVAIKHNPNLKTLYLRLQANGKSKMSALGAVMRKLAHLCFGVLKNQQPYQPNYASTC
jgi:transposase